MTAITKFYSDGEVDIMQSVKATVEASTEQFSVEDVFNALSQANPTDEYLELDTVRRAVKSLATNASAVAKEVADGLYVRN